MRTKEEIAATLSTLSERIDAEFGYTASMGLIQSMISGALARKAMEQVESALGTYSTAELMLAAQVLGGGS